MKQMLFLFVQEKNTLSLMMFHARPVALLFWIELN